MIITRTELRNIIRETFEWTPELKARWKESLETDRRNREHRHGVERMNPDVVYDQLSQAMQAYGGAGETYLEFVLDALDNENWAAAVNGVLDALWITDIPVAADEALETLLMGVQNEDDLAGAVAMWVPRYWKVNNMGRIMGRK